MYLKVKYFEVNKESNLHFKLRKLSKRDQNIHKYLLLR
jgi:hypothetical protein